MNYTQPLLANSGTLIQKNPKFFWMSFPGIGLSQEIRQYGLTNQNAIFRDENFDLDSFWAFFCLIWSLERRFFEFLNFSSAESVDPKSKFNSSILCPITLLE